MRKYKVVLTVTSMILKRPLLVDHFKHFALFTLAMTSRLAKLTDLRVYIYSQRIFTFPNLCKFAVLQKS